MDFMKYLPNGQAVCGRHGLIVCGKCCVDFDDDIFRRPSDEEDDRVFILGPGLNRFVPQSDEEVRGPANVIGMKSSNNDIGTSAAIDIEDCVCSECGLTWLVGESGLDSARNHPSHHTLYHDFTGQTRRSLLVHVDGACADDGQPGARAGIGVFFAPQSKYNVSQAFNGTLSITSQKAELEAILQAMQIVRLEVMPTRSIFVGGDSDKKQLRLILVTDSRYVVECMCQHWENWRTAGDVLRNKKGKVVANSKELIALNAEVEALSRVGVQVVYHHVPRELNQQADSLAKAGVSKASSGAKADAAT